MSILIFDQDNFDRAKKMAAALRDGGADVVISYQGECYDANGTEVAQTKSFALTFCHYRNENALANSGIDPGVIIFYSGGGADIPRAISAADGFTKAEAEHICDVASQSPGTDLKHRVLSYWKSNPEKYALCLLCEAWLITGGEAQAQVAPGITVHAPTKLDEWLDPFGPNSTKDSVAKQMGRLEVVDAAHGVFAAIDTKRSRPNRIRGALKKFLEISARRPVRG